MMTSPALARRVLAPDGTVLTLADLPPPDAQRWVASRKAVVVAAVRGGLLSMSDACARYRLTTEKFLNWRMQVDRNGLRGLRATRIQEYRGVGRRTGVHDAHSSPLTKWLFRPGGWSKAILKTIRAGMARLATRTMMRASYAPLPVGSRPENTSRSPRPLSGSRPRSAGA